MMITPMKMKLNHNYLVMTYLVLLLPSIGELRVQLLLYWIKVDAVVATLFQLQVQSKVLTKSKLENSSRCLSSNFLIVQVDHMVTKVVKVDT